MRIYKSPSLVPPDKLREALGLTSKLIEFNPNHDERGQFSSGTGGGGGGAGGGRKQPHEMTKKEWEGEREKYQGNYAYSKHKGTSVSSHVVAAEELSRLGHDHKHAVSYAIDTGADVPDEVLNDYPDLKQRWANTPPKTELDVTGIAGNTAQAKQKRAEVFNKAFRRSATARAKQARAELLPDGRIGYSALTKGINGEYRIALSHAEARALLWGQDMRAINKGMGK